MVDLDPTLRFAQQTLVLTSHRFLASGNGGVSWNAWTLQPGLTLHYTDHAGIGTLELHDTTACVGRWRFTLALSLPALRLLKQFEEQSEALRSNAVPADPTVPAEPEESDEPGLFTQEKHEPPSTWVLLRLLRFAQP